MSESKLITLGKSILKDSVGNVIKEFDSSQNLLFDISSSDYRGMPDEFMFLTDGARGFNGFSYTGLNDAIRAYTKCAPLNAIINKKAKSYVNGKTWVMNSKGKESQTADAKKLRKLLLRPNPLQSWKQFEAQQKIYMEMFGWCICLPIIPVGFEQFGPVEASAIWNIPPFIVDIIETNKLFYQTDLPGIIQSIKLNYKGITSFLDVKNIYIFKDFTPNFSSQIFPESRICALQTQVNNIMGAYESRNILINKRGAMGILTMGGGDAIGAIPLPQKEKDRLQGEFSRYGLKNGQWQVIISSAQLAWQQIGYPTKDLMLFEEIIDDIQRLSDGFDFPYQLLANEKSNSLGGNEQNAFQRNLYQDAIIPEAESTYEQWNQFFRTDEMNIDIQKDYSHIPCMQEDKVNQGKSFLYKNQGLLIPFQNNLITANQWLEAIEFDTVPGLDLTYSQMVDAGMTFAAAGPAPTGNEAEQLPNSTNPSSTTS